MKKQKIFGLLGIVFLGLLWACQPPVTPEQAQSAVETAGKIAVALDSVHGEASTTKNFYFLFDGSGSMADGCSGKSKIEWAKEAAVKFLSKIPDGVNVGLLVFDQHHNCQEVMPLTLNGKKTFETAVMKIEAGGGTPLGEAITIGTEKLVDQYKKQLGYGEYRLIVITDGQAENAGTMENACVSMARYEFISLYSIGLCLSTTHALKSFGISYRDAANPQDLEKALEQSVAEIQSFDGGAYDSTAYSTAAKKK